MNSGRAQPLRVAVGAAVLLVGGGYAATSLLGGDSDPVASPTDKQSVTVEPVAPDHEGHEPDTDSGADTEAEGHDHGANHHGVEGNGTSTAFGGYELSGVRYSDGQFAFRVLDESGAPVDRFEVVHEKRLHMFVFNTDLSEFRHVHPTQRGGSWTLGLGRLPPGSHRVVTEFTPVGSDAAVMLGVEIEVPGRGSEDPLPPPSTTVQVDRYTVSWAGDLAPGRSSELKVTVIDPDGAPAELEPYLGSWAHGALIHADALTVAHLHPVEHYQKGAESPDRITLPTPLLVSGEQRLIVEFATATGVHQAEFTLASHDAS